MQRTLPKRNGSLLKNIDAMAGELRQTKKGWMRFSVNVLTLKSRWI